MKLIFAVFYVSTTGLTRCCKTLVFYIYICSFSAAFYAISISDTCLRSRKSISKQNFDKISQTTAVILHLSAKFRSNWTIDGGVVTSYRIFKMAAIDSEIYFRIKIYWQHLFDKATFWWDISVPSWDNTTSDFAKGTAAISQFYYRFRFWGVCCHRHVILHPPAKFRSNRTIDGGVMTSYWIFKMAAIESEMYFRVQV